MVACKLLRSQDLEYDDGSSLVPLNNLVMADSRMVE